MFRVTELGRYVTLNDGGNYVTSHELNVRIKINKNNNSSERELGPPVPHIVLRLKQANFKARFHDLKDRLVSGSLHPYHFCFYSITL